MLAVFYRSRMQGQAHKTGVVTTPSTDPYEGLEKEHM